MLLSVEVAVSEHVYLLIYINKIQIAWTNVRGITVGLKLLQARQNLPKEKLSAFP